MYKTRLAIILTAILVLMLTFINVTPRESKVEMQIYFDNTSAEVRDCLTGSNGKLKTRLGTLDEANIIVSTDTNKEMQGYDMIRLAYSPVVMVFPEEAIKNGSAHFNIDKNSLGNEVYKKDFKNILLELEKSNKDEGLSAESIGIDGDGKYKLIIPGVESQYRKIVIDTFINELLDGESPTEENIAKIKESLDKIVENCYTTLDIQGVIDDINGSGYIIAFPEHLLDKNKSTSPILIYSANTVCEQLVAYYDTSKISEEVIKSWSESLQEDRLLSLKVQFSSGTGYRVRGGTWNINTPFAASLDVVNNVSINQQDLETLLGKDYWK